MSVAAVQNVEDEGNTDPEETPEKTNQVADGVATIYVSKAGDFKTFVDGDGCTDEFKKATRINIIGTGVTLNNDDLAAVSTFESLKLLDLSQVTVTDYSKIKNATVDYNLKAISLLVSPLANTTNEDGSVKYADQVANVRNVGALTDNNSPKFNSVFAVNKNESGVTDLFAMFNNGTNADLLTTVATEKNPGNLVIISSTTDWSFSNNFTDYILPEINKVTSAKCLVLSNLANGTQLDLSGITNSAFKRVILPDNYSKQGWTLETTTFGEGSDVKVVQYLKERWIDQQNKTNDFLTYVREAGGLAEINDCHYYQTNMSEAHSMIFSGNIKAEDISFLNGAKNNRVSLQALTHVDAEGKNVPLTETLKNFKNDYIEYMTLPDGAVEPVDYNFTETFQNCKSLKGLGMAWTVTTPAAEEGGEDTKSTGVAITSKERGAAYEVEQLLISFTHPENDQTTYCRLANADKVVFSGLIYAQDLIPRNSNDFYTDANGHLSVSIDADGALSKGTTGTNTYGVMHANKATTWDFSRVRLYDDSDNYTDEQKAAAQNDLCFSALGYTPTKVYLPEDESVYRLPSSCFANNGKLTSLCIPSNYTELGSCALQNVNTVTNVYASYKDDKGTKYWIINGKTQTTEPTATEIAEENTCSLPINLTRIEHYCFANIDKFTDVYVQNNKAGEVPYCEQDAFDASSLYGFAGYKGDHPISRASYNNGSKHFALLHFPSGLKRAQTMLYTDITRQYSQVDETGATDGNGDLLIWPTQGEWVAAESQANTGYIWSDWTDWTAVATTTVMARSEFKKDGSLTELATKLGLTDLTGSNTFAPATDETPVTKGNTWMGWHQFVLTAAYDYQSDDPNPKWHTYITDDNWWTISLPFDMTYEQIESTFGEGTKLCTLTGVVRNATDNTITLQFGKDLVAEAKTASSTAAVLVNRAPYMIKPGKLEKLQNETDGENEHSGPIFTLTDGQNASLKNLNLISYAEKTIADLLADENNKCAVVVNATNADGKYIDENNEVIADDATDPAYYKYIFVAQYTKYYIPTYGYFLGWDNDASKANYFYQTVEATKQNWNAYTCTIGHYTPSEAKWVMPGTGTDVKPGRWEFSCVKDAQSNYNARSLHEDKMPGTPHTSDAKHSIIMEFGADNTTSIEGISANGSVKTVPAGVVYNLNGQVVSTNGINGLAKGIYIANGKKFIVK